MGVVVDEVAVEVSEAGSEETVMVGWVLSVTGEVDLLKRLEMAESLVF
jgi:hypothetical protein